MMNLFSITIGWLYEPFIRAWRAYVSHKRVKQKKNEKNKWRIEKMKRKLVLLAMILLITSIFANTAPVVESVTASQRTDGSGIVDIYYDVSDADGDTLSVVLQLSEDAGSTFSITPIFTSGDIGSNILSGTGKHIIWNAGSENYTLGNNQYQFKVIVEDGYESITVTDIDGNVYQTVQIGNQLWMAENLKVTHYRNGDAIPNVTDNSTWAGLSSGAYCVYNNDSANADTYGNLYNWYAVADARNIAPEGWHVPTDEEIMELEMALGMSQSQANTAGWRGTNEGSKLAGRADLWTNGVLENDPEFDTSGFSFLPGGYRYDYNGAFNNMRSTGYLWSSTEYNSNYARYRKLICYYTHVYRDYYYKRHGISVRCVRD